MKEKYNRHVKFVKLMRLLLKLKNEKIHLCKTESDTATDDSNIKFATYIHKRPYIKINTFINIH